MPLGKALHFIRQARFDDELREACYRMPSKQELLKVLDFDMNEFEDAFNMELVKCQTREEAETIYQLKDWFQMI